MKKRCFKCGQDKFQYEFYPHLKMGDGLLGKCKECAKEDARAVFNRNRLNPSWIDRERVRCRVKAKIARELGKAKPSSLATRAKWASGNPHKISAQRRANAALKSGKLVRKHQCEQCGAIGTALQKHHHDYSKPLDVIWLCCPCHGIAHRKPNLIAA